MTRYKEYSNNITPAVPYLLLIDAEGYQAFTNAGEFHTWDTSIVQTNNFTFTVGTNKVFLDTNSSGLFKVTYNCSYGLGQGGGDVITTSLYKNGVEITGSRVQDMITIDEADIVSQSSTFVLFLSKGDSVQVRTVVGVGTIALSQANTSRILIEFIPMHGGNNGSGGRVDYKGAIRR